jgi:predicted nucleotidyltransferase
MKDFDLDVVRDALVQTLTSLEGVVLAYLFGSHARGQETCSMDITPIVARLSIIRGCVNALSEIRPLTYDEFISDHVFIASFARHVSDWLMAQGEEL